MAYLPIDRKHFEDFLWNEARIFSKAEAAIDLVQSARFEASTELIAGKVIEIQRGEIPASRRFLEKRWQWGSSKVDKFMKLLIKIGYINQKQTNGQTIYTIVNYELTEESKPPTNHKVNQRQTSGKPAANQRERTKLTQVTKLLNYSFDEFWNAYDKKVGDKTKLEAKWAKLTAADREAAMRHIPPYTAATPDKKFRKNPQTYLNNKSWNDEILNTQNNERSNKTTNHGARSASVKDAIFAEVSELG